MQTLTQCREPLLFDSGVNFDRNLCGCDNFFFGISYSLVECNLFLFLVWLSPQKFVILCDVVVIVFVGS